uniref:Uncharacterized protein n=1 Tax=Magallana gigas TaxID=29159 RepID=A0A8W8MMA9_MAGGI
MLTSSPVLKTFEVELNFSDLFFRPLKSFCCELPSCKVSHIALVETVAKDSDISWRDGRRIVELKHIADQMFCVKCSQPLHLSHIVEEKISGLGSFLHIQCPSVFTLTP